MNFDVRIVVTPLFSECQSCAVVLSIWGAPTIGLLLGQVVLNAGFLEEEIGKMWFWVSWRICNFSGLEKVLPRDSWYW